METNSTKILIDITRRKGIDFDYKEQELFKRYSYYQVINAYKNLFVISTEEIETIKNNINNNVNIEYYKKSFKINDNDNTKLYENICNKICHKYGLTGTDLLDKESQIKEIKYHHHIYAQNVKYGDFVRMYKFEHELRMMLLKYILIIEESVKNIFISYLNDKKAEANYLINMDNYNTESLKSKSFDTMKLIIGKYDNQKSKPVARKRDQKLPVPYWILINELAMNQTYHAIDNLNPKDSNAIFLRCTNFFTKLKIKEENRGKSPTQIDNEKKLVDTCKSIINYLGEFRNMLAHNQPIYDYNISKFNVNNMSKFEYELPKTNSGKKDRHGRIISRNQQQINLNGRMMNNLVTFFGQDNFNSNNSTNLDLSKIIYILYKFLNNIDKNTNFYEELVCIYAKYNIILSKNEHYLNNHLYYSQLEEKLQKLNNYTFDSSYFINKIESNDTYKRQLKQKEIEIKSIKKDILNISSKIKLLESRSKYKIFSAMKRYSEFTGIDLNLFANIK